MNRIIDNLPIEQYHGDASTLSYSGLMHFKRSPAHYYALHLDSSRPAPEPKPGQLEGTLAHCAILEPDEFDRRYVVGPEVSRSTKAWKDWEAQQTLTPIKPDQRTTALAQAQSVRRMPDVAALLAQGRAEVSAYWVDEFTGMACRCRPDFVSPAGNGVILVDVKTCSDASPSEFARQIARKSYHGQNAWYSDGYSKASGLSVLGFVFVAVEMQWPYAACALMIDDRSIESAAQSNREALKQFAKCKQSGEWLGYSKEIELVTLPEWAF